MAPSCQEAGVLGVLCGVIGALEATEAIKVLLGTGKTLSGRELRFDALGHEVPRVQAPARSDLPGLRRRQDARADRAHRLPPVLQRQELEAASTRFAFANGAGSAPRDEARNFALGVDGFRYGHLYEPERLAALDAQFRAALAAGDAALAGRFTAYREGGTLTPPEESALLIEVARPLGAFVARLFGVEPRARRSSTPRRARRRSSG